MSLRTSLVAFLFISGLAILQIPTQSFAEEYRCPTWGYSDIEAQVELSKLQREYSEALEREQDPNYQPAFSERSTEEVNDDIYSITTTCIPEIKGYVKSQLDNSYPLYFSGGAGVQCLGDYPMSRSTAKANLNSINERIVMIGNLQSDIGLSYRTAQDLIGQERSVGQIFQQCYDYFELTGQTQEEPDINLPIDEELETHSECIIATAAFGSNLAPQVQVLRNFRDNHILSTTAGSSFMTVFNNWYYSFSPSIAEYERGQPWMQQIVRTAIYPLLGILQASEKAYSSIPGEFGAMLAGLIASSMIGAVYFSPVALSLQRIRKTTISYKISVCAVAATALALVVSIILGNSTFLMITTSLFVLTVIAASALLFARLIITASNKIQKRFGRSLN